MIDWSLNQITDIIFIIFAILSISVGYVIVYKLYHITELLSAILRICHYENGIKNKLIHFNEK